MIYQSYQDMIQNDDVYNTTDCITTSKSLYKLFNSRFQKLVINCSKTVNHKLKELLDINNFVGVTIHGENVAIHKIVLIKIENIWYMCESYNGSYTMKIREVNAYQLLSHMDTEMYLDLYENEDINKFYITKYFS